MFNIKVNMRHTFKRVKLSKKKKEKPIHIDADCILTKLYVCNLNRFTRYIIEFVGFIIASTVFTITAKHFNVSVTTKTDYRTSSRSIPKQLHTHGTQIQDGDEKGNSYQSAFSKISLNEENKIRTHS